MAKLLSGSGTISGLAHTAATTLPTEGISSGNHFVATSGIADDDFLRVAGTSIEGRSASEVLSDISGIGASNPTVTLGSNATFPTGHVLQTVFAQSTTATEITATSITGGTAINLSVALDCASTSNWVLLNVGVHIFMYESSDPGVGIYVHDGSGIVATDTANTAHYTNISTSTEYSKGRHYLTKLFHPSSDANLTYTVYAAEYYGSVTAHAQYGGEQSSITLQEIQA